MFSVYGSSGRLFRGTLEQLRQIGPVHAVDRTRTIEPVARDGRDSALREAVEHETGAVREPLRSALAAYVSQSPAAAQRWAAAAVESVMSHDVLSITNTSTIAQAWQLLEFHGFGQAPVVDADAALVGLVTYSHLLRFSQLPGPDSKLQDWLALLQHSVESAMLTPVPSVAADAQLRGAASVLLESGLPGLPVVNDAGHVTGFLSRSDILRAVLHDTPLDQWG